MKPARLASFPRELPWGAAWPDGFSGPDGVAFDGTHLWVTNPGNDSVTELWNH
jgi:hypothetical protein